MLTNQIARALGRGPRRRHPEDATTDLAGLEPYPEPTVMISLRHGRTYRATDDEGRPLLIITDGVSAAALDIGLSGLSYGTVTAARRLAEAVGDFASSLDGAWNTRQAATAATAQGRHRRNLRRLPWGQGRNIQRVISRWAR